MSETFVETEKLIHSLSDELLKLKSAVEHYESSQRSLDAIRDSIQKVGDNTLALVETTRVSMELIQQDIGQHDQAMKMRIDAYVKKLRLSQGLIFVLLVLEAATLIAIFLR
jgi:small-conductance mechanosensitive channel